MEGPLELLSLVATALGDLRERVVFIGGATAPLLQTDRPFAAPRPTRDVDAIIVTASYSDFQRIAEELRARGFREMQAARHAHKWVTPGMHEIEFDLVPVGTRPLHLRRRPRAESISY
jgi:predicted nucleotidyltransferase